MASPKIALAALLAALHAAATASWGFQPPPHAPRCFKEGAPRSSGCVRAHAQRCSGVGRVRLLPGSMGRAPAPLAGLRMGAGGADGETDLRVERLLRGSSRARDVRDAIALADAGKAELNRGVVLLMMRACRATGEWRRCLSLHRRLGGGDAEAFSVAVGACARWGAARDTWGLLTGPGAAGLREGLSVSAVCRVWVQANEQAGEARKVLIPGPAHTIVAAPKGKKGGLRLRAVRPTGRSKEALSMHDFRVLAADLVTLRLPPEVLSPLIGHPGPAAALATHHGCSEREGRLRLMKARAHTAHAKGALPAVLHALEEAERSGVVDLHGCSASEALFVVEAAVASLRHASCLHLGVGGGGPGGSGALRIVTGRGLHSEGGVAVIKPAVESLLQRMAVPFDPLEGNGGALDCRL